MSRADRTIEDTAKIYGAQLLAAGFALIFSAWLVRTLPGTELSLWPICISLAAVVEVVACLGMGDLFVRIVPSLLERGKQAEAAALLRTGLGLNVLVACAVTGAILASTETWAELLQLKGEVPVSVIQMLAAAILFTAMYMNFERALYAVQEFGKVALIKLVCKVLRAGLAVLLYVLFGIKGAVFGLSAVALLSVIIAAIGLWPHVAIFGHPHQPLRVISQAIPYYGAALANLGTARLDYLIVGVLTTSHTLAGYYVARKLADYLGQLDTSAIEAVTPKLAERRTEGPEAIRKAFKRCSRYLLLGLLPVHVGLAITAAPIVQLYAGSNYPTAGLILSVMSLGLFIGVVAQLYRAHVIVFAKRWHLILLNGTSGLLSLSLTAVLVYYIAGLGAALAQAAGFLVQAVVALAILKAFFAPKHDWQAAKTALVGSLLVAGTGILVNRVAQGSWSIPLIMASGIGVYFLALVNKLERNDIDLIWRLIPQRLLHGRHGVHFKTSLTNLLCRPWSESYEAK